MLISKEKSTILLAIILFASLLFRLFYIEDRALYGHEMNAVTISLNGWNSRSMVEANGFSYYSLILGPAIKTFGLNPLAARLPSVFFSLMSIVLVFFCARRMFDRNVALFSAFFLGINSFSILCAKYSRFYSFNTCCCLLATFVILKVTMDNCPKWWHLFTLSMFLSVTSMLSSLFLYLADFIYMVYASLDKLKATFRVSLLTVVLYIVFRMEMNMDKAAIFRIARYQDINYDSAVRFFFRVLGLDYATIENYNLVSLGFYFPFWAVILLLLLFGLFCLCFEVFKRKQPLLVLLSVVLPIVMVVVESLQGVNIFSVQNLGYIIPFVCIILGLGLAKLPKVLRLAVLICLMAQSSAFVIPFASQAGVGPKVKQAYVEQFASSDDVILYVDDKPNSKMQIKYNNIPVVNVNPDKIIAFLHKLPEKNPHNRLWLACNSMYEKQCFQAITEQLNCKKAWRYNWLDQHIEVVYLFLLDNNAAKDSLLKPDDFNKGFKGGHMYSEK